MANKPTQPTGAAAALAPQRQKTLGRLGMITKGTVLSWLLLAACSGERTTPAPVLTPRAHGQALAGLVMPDTWGLAKSDGGGPSELVRYREKMGAVIGSGLLPRRLVATWDALASSVGARDTAEDQLTMLLEGGTHTVLCLVRTGVTVRHWVFYCADSDEASRRVDLVRDRAESLGLAIVIEQDPTWSMYREFTPK